MLRIIMFEDNDKFRKSIISYFENHEDIYLAAAFSNAMEAVKQVRQYQPDVVMMDINMPGVSGLDAVHQIKVAFPDVKVLMLTGYDEDDKVFSSICFGASGYILKSENDDLAHSIIEVSKGRKVMTPSIAARVWKMFESNIVQSQPHYVNLTERQKAVLQCMVEGKNRRTIATKLDIAPDTVGDHIKDIYKKLHVNSATAAVREAILRRLI